MATVEVRFTALPAHVRTARLVATAVARRAGVAEELLDEVRLAVGEACSRAVGLHQRSAPAAPVRITMTDGRELFSVVVCDSVLDPGDDLELPAAEDGSFEGALKLTGRGPATDLLPPGFGLAVIAGLVDDVEVERAPDGTAVRMSWPVLPAGAAGA